MKDLNDVIAVNNILCFAKNTLILYVREGSFVFNGDGKDKKCNEDISIKGSNKNINNDINVSGSDKKFNSDIHISDSDDENLIFDNIAFDNNTFSNNVFEDIATQNFSDFDVNNGENVDKIKNHSKESAKNHKKARIKIPAKAGIWYILTGILSRGIGMVGTPIFSRLLSPSEYGIYPLYMTWLGIFTAFATFELTGSVILRGLQKFEDRKDEFITATFGLFLAVFVPISLFYFIFHDFFNRLTDLNTELFTLLLIQIFFNTVIAFYTSRAKYEYKYKKCAVITFLLSALTPILSVLLVVYLKLGGEGRILGTVIVTASVAMPLIFPILRVKKNLFNEEMWKFLFKFNLPLLPHYISMALILRVGEAVVGKVFGHIALAKYSVAMSVGLSLTMISAGAISALGPWILRKIKARENEKISEMLSVTAKMLSILTLLMLSVAPEVLLVITPPEYRDCLICVFPLALCVVPIYLSNSIMSAEIYFEKNFTATLPSVVTATLSTVLSLWLLPKFDYRAVAFYALLSYVTLTVLNIFSFKRIARVFPFSLSEMTFSFIFTVLYATPLYLLRENFLSRIILAVVLLPALFYYGRIFFKYIKEKKTT